MRRVLSRRETVKLFPCVNTEAAETLLPTSTEITPFYGTEVTCNNRWLTAISFSSPLTSAPPSNPIHRPLPLVRHLFLPRGFDGTYLITSSNGFQTKNSVEYPYYYFTGIIKKLLVKRIGNTKGMKVFLE